MHFNNPPSLQNILYQIPFIAPKIVTTKRDPRDCQFQLPHFINEESEIQRSEVTCRGHIITEWLT